MSNSQYQMSEMHSLDTVSAALRPVVARAAQVSVPMDQKVAYDIRHLTKQYVGAPYPANNDICLQIYQGEIFGILGDNGAGKTTLVQQMVNLLPSTSGSIALFGQDISANPLLVPMCVGYMPQNALALNNLSVQESLYFTAHLRGLQRGDAQKERDRLIDLWNLHPIRKQTVRYLSGGQRRLLQLAIAMAASPPVLILDEPTNELDPQNRRHVWEVIRHLNRTQGITIIFITHDAIEAEKAIQRVGIMHQGRLVAMGRPSDLKQALGQKVRLELMFMPENPPQLPPEIVCHQIEPGRWFALLDVSQVGPVLTGLDLSKLDDFRLLSATLEDLYFHYITQSSQAVRS